MEGGSENRDLEAGLLEDPVEERLRLHHPVLGLVLEERLVVLAYGGAEYDGGDPLKQVDPFPPLVSLASRVVKPVHLPAPLVLAHGAEGDQERKPTFSLILSMASRMLTEACKWRSNKPTTTSKPTFYHQK